MTKKKKRNTGQLFQNNIQRSLLPTTYYYRLIDGPGAWSQGDKARFTPSNLCDYVIFLDGCLYMTEAKATAGKSLPFGNVRASQKKGYKKLEKQKEKVEGLHGLFLIEFWELKETYAVFSEDILHYMKTADRKSFPIAWLEEVGVKLDLRKGKIKQIEIEKGLRELKKKRGEKNG